MIFDTSINGNVSVASFALTEIRPTLQNAVMDEKARASRLDSEKQSRSLKTCWRCGKSGSADFCEDCGAPLIQQFCVECGAAANTPFCSGCGSVVNERAAQMAREVFRSVETQATQIDMADLDESGDASADGGGLELSDLSVYESLDHVSRPVEPMDLEGCWMLIDGAWDLEGLAFSLEFLVALDIDLDGDLVYSTVRLRSTGDNDLVRTFEFSFEGKVAGDRIRLRQVGPDRITLRDGRRGSAANPPPGTRYISAGARREMSLVYERVRSGLAELQFRNGYLCGPTGEAVFERTDCDLEDL